MAKFFKLIKSYWILIFAILMVVMTHISPMTFYFNWLDTEIMVTLGTKHERTLEDKLKEGLKQAEIREL